MSTQVVLYLAQLSVVSEAHYHTLSVFSLVTLSICLACLAGPWDLSSWALGAAQQAQSVSCLDDVYDG